MPVDMEPNSRHLAQITLESESSRHRVPDEWQGGICGCQLSLCVGRSDVTLWSLCCGATHHTEWI